MDPSSGEGGTKINRKPKLVNSPPQMNASPPQQQMVPPPQQMGPPPQQMGPPPQQMGPPPQQMRPQYNEPPQQMRPQYNEPPQYNEVPPPRYSSRNKENYGAPVIIPNKKSNFGSILDNSNFKNSLLVVFLFIILNSKLVWKQIQKIPMMGKVEPSMVALIFNSILAGIIFFLIKTFVMKN